MYLHGGRGAVYLHWCRGAVIYTVLHGGRGSVLQGVGAVCYRGVWGSRFTREYVMSRPVVPRPVVT